MVPFEKVCDDPNVLEFESQNIVLNPYNGEKDDNGFIEVRNAEHYTINILKHF